jgi:hypothetical protein
MAFYIEVFHALFGHSLFAEIEFNASRFLRSCTLCVDNAVWLEKCPQKVVCDVVAS